LVAPTYTVEFARSVVVHGKAVAFAPPIAVIDGKDLLASTHAVMRGKAVEKMFASRLTSPNGGGSSGIVRPTPTSTVRETLASTRVNMPSDRRLSASCVGGQSGVQSRKIHGHESVRFELFEEVEAYRNGRLKSKTKEDIGVGDVHVEWKWCKGRLREAIDATVGDVGEL
jgi:hypothetical protein